MKKRTIIKTLLLSGLALGGLAFSQQEASAHGYVKEPASRGYMGSLEKDTLGWTQAYNKYGNVITNPQSLEFSKGFPQAGPADGQIASAEGGLGQIADSVLDNQTSDRWNKTDIETGVNTFTWRYTAAHSTTKWHYYMTKEGWNPNEPLKRENLELIGEVQHDGSAASNNSSHQINVPSDRSGYHVILAVWDVSDTPNAFYNVIDVNVKNDGKEEVTDTEAPTKPTELKATEVSTHSANLSWTASTDNTGVKEYRVYRDGKQIGTVSSTKFEDKNLEANTNYNYQVEAVDFAGNVSEKSEILNVKTQAMPEVDTEAPTKPTNLHTMKITENSVNLMWTASKDNVGVKEYQIFRDNKLVGTSTKNSFADKNLKASTTYNYTVKAIDEAGNVSEASSTLKVTTLAAPTVSENEWQAGSFTSPKIYKYGEEVTYKGNTYRVMTTHYNYGDQTWAPDVAPTLFQAK